MSPIAAASTAEPSITHEIARWRPHRSAASLPSTLQGRASSVNAVDTATGPSGMPAPGCATTNPQKATIQVRRP